MAMRIMREEYVYPCGHTVLLPKDPGLRRRVILDRGAHRCADGRVWMRPSPRSNWLSRAVGRLGKNRWGTGYRQGPSA